MKNLKPSDVASSQIVSTGDPFAPFAIEWQPSATSRPMSESAPSAPNVNRTQTPRITSRPAETPHWPSWAFMADGPAGGAYCEEAFRYLLAIERKRAERSGRSFLLLLVDLKHDTGQPMRIDATIAANLFAGLSAALRETDFIGWYREGRVAGAVLAQHTTMLDSEISHAVNLRIREQLCERMSPGITSRLQTRVFQLPRKTQDRE